MIVEVVRLQRSTKIFFWFRLLPTSSKRFRKCRLRDGHGIDVRLFDSHDDLEGDVWERIVRGAKSYTRAQWDDFFRTLEALPEKPRNEQRVTVSDAMKEKRVQIAATQAKGYTLEEIVQEAERKGIDVSIGAIKYALYRPAPADANSEVTDTRGKSSGQPPSGRKKVEKRAGDARDDIRQQRERGVSQPGSMQIQDAFSFEIRPDIENL
ncbi:hypothetical protein [Paraburkholderia fungorum]|uniref:hypothetical protein n=1 Tax=Paraburkholderia fungorum TaxID=134537 RepID=UPI00209833C9|nr:hypothetical protein [Paraburkholderia fungorum]USX04921.1 hypothetical protein NHH62_17595 [Paraburkholderia fungorum]